MRGTADLFAGEGKRIRVPLEQFMTRPAPVQDPRRNREAMSVTFSERVFPERAFCDYEMIEA